MPVTKQYLRYALSGTVGVICSRQCAPLLLERSVAKEKRLLAIAPALQDVVVWDLRTGEKVSNLSDENHEVASLALSASTQRVAAGYEDGSIRLWDLESQTCQVILSGHRLGVTCLVFDGSGMRLASGSKDTDVIVWDVINESGLFQLRGHKGVVTSCRFVSDHNLLVTGSKDTLVKLWDLDTQHCFQTLVGHCSEVWAVELLAGDTRLVSGSADRELRVFSVCSREESETPVGRDGAKSGRAFCEPMGTIVRQNSGRVQQMKVDPSGVYLAVLSGEVCLEVFRIRSRDEIEQLVRKKLRKARRRSQRDGSEEEAEPSVSITPSDELLLIHTHTTSSKRKIKYFDICSNTAGIQLLLLLHNNSLELHSFTLSSSSSSNLKHTITAAGHRSDIRSVCISSDSALIASGSSDMVKIWNRSSMQCVLTMPTGYVVCCEFVPGDRHLLVGTKAGEIQLFEVASGRLLESLDAHSGAVWSVGVAPDRTGFASGSADHDIKFWKFELTSEGEDGIERKRLTAAHTKTLKMSEDVLCVKYSPDQRLFAAALLDCTVKVLFSDTLKFFLSLYGHKLPILSLDISSDSSLLVTGSADKNIKIWGLDYGDCHRSLFAHDNSIMAVRFVPKTHLVFSVSKDRALKCWDADSFEHIQTLQGHQAEVWALAVSRDGNTVVTGSHDFSLRVWQCTREPLILSQERQNEREARFDAAAAEGGEPLMHGDGGAEAVMVGRKTMETMKSTERVMEAIDLYRSEEEKRSSFEEECRVAGRELAAPPPHPILVALGNPTPEKYVLSVVKKVKSSDLEETLVVLPFAYVVPLLGLLDTWLKHGWEVELSCRCLLFLLRIHHHQLTANKMLLLLMDSLRHHSSKSVDSLRDVIGFNLAALQHLRGELEHSGISVFEDVSQLLQNKGKRRRKTRCTPASTALLRTT